MGVAKYSYSNSDSWQIFDSWMQAEMPNLYIFEKTQETKMINKVSGVLKVYIFAAWTKN